MATIKLFSPSRSHPWDRAAARHLLERAGFGGPVAEVDRLVELGPRDAVAKLLDYPEAGDEPPPDFLTMPEVDYTELRKLPEKERREKFNEIQRANRQAVMALKSWWLTRMITSDRPLEEKLTLFWHGHFATEAQKVKQAGMLYDQNQLLRRHGRGKFRDLLLGISQDPAMLYYLDNQLNRKGHPNENYAREMFELFSLGIGHYTESDVLESARAFTGWTVRRNGPRGRGAAEGFQMIPAWHDDGQKTVLGQTGDFDGADIVDLALTQPSCAPFIVGKLWRFFVNDGIGGEETAAIDALANVFRASGYQLKPILETIFLSDLFYAERQRGAKIKSPAELLVGTARRLGIVPEGRQAYFLAFSMRSLGQDLLDPPNVAGWGGGQEWINTSTLLQRYNLMNALVNGPGAQMGGGRDGRFAGRVRGQMAPALPVPKFKSAEELVHLVVEEHLVTPLDADQQAVLAEYARAALRERDGAEAAYRQVLHLVLSTPNYQAC